MSTVQSSNNEKSSSRRSLDDHYDNSNIAYGTTVCSDRKILDNTNNTATSEPQKIAIVGASFAGFALAISLLNHHYEEQHRIMKQQQQQQQQQCPHITIIDSSTPLSENSCIHQVLGPLTLRSGTTLLKQLNLRNLTNEKENITVNIHNVFPSLEKTTDDKKQEIATTVDRLELKRWLYNQCKNHNNIDILHNRRVVKLIEVRDHHTNSVTSLNIFTENAVPTKLDDINHTEKDKNEQSLGPFDLVVGADGVLSTIRTLAKQIDVTSLPSRIALIGDARWVHEVWYDFGYQRIQQGANIALIDGLTLGKSIALQQYKQQQQRDNDAGLSLIQLGHFDVNFVQQKIKMNRTGIVAILVAFFAWIVLQ